jgi:hypothetical protein
MKGLEDYNNLKRMSRLKTQHKNKKGHPKMPNNAIAKLIFRYRLSVLFLQEELLHLQYD